MNKKILFIFDVDGTLTRSRMKIDKDMKNFLYKLSNEERFHMAFVGGSDLEKQKEQLGDDVLGLFHYKFPENGIVAYKGSELIHKKSFFDFINEKDYQDLINFCLKYIANLDLPKKRGNFIELRTGLVNVSPIGRNCSYEERLEFFEFDKNNKIREKMVEDLKKKFPELPLDYAIGGQISIDIFPNGLNKTYCLNHINKEDYEKIYFFGDKTHEGGNDYELFIHPDVEGYNVESPDDTIRILKKIMVKI